MCHIHIKHRLSQERFAACLWPVFLTSQGGYRDWSSQVVTAEAMTKRLGNIKRDFMSFGMMLKRSGTQAVFSSILPAGDWDQRRRQCTDQVNDWLHSSCHNQGFRFYDLGMLLRDGAF